MVPIVRAVSALVLALVAAALVACEGSHPSSGGSISTNSQGAVQAWGRDVTVDQTVSALRVTNGNVVVNGTVEGEVDVWNGRLTVNGQIGRDVRLSQGELALRRGAQVGGGVFVWNHEQNVQVDGQVAGDLQVSDGRVGLGPSAVVAGNVKVWRGSFDRAPGARVGGSVQNWT